MPEAQLAFENPCKSICFRQIEFGGGPSKKKKHEQHFLLLLLKEQAHFERIDRYRFHQTWSLIAPV
jgi:hypothetical protein